MGKKRGTAKTGDQKLYASRSAEEDKAASALKQNSKTEDYMALDAVDQYHSNRDFMMSGEGKGVGGRGKYEQEDVYEGAETGVFDLGGNDSDDDDNGDYNDDDSEESEDEAPQKTKKSSKKAAQSDSDSDSDSSDDALTSSSDEEEEEKETSALSWGSKKRTMYGGDVNDIEIGQEVQDAYDEETAANEILKEKYKSIEKGNYYDDDDEDDDDDDNNSATTTSTSTSKKGQTEHLSLPSTTSTYRTQTLPQKLTLLQKLSPSTLPLLKHFTSKLNALQSKVNPVHTAISNEAKGVLGTNDNGYDYLKLKELALLMQMLNGVQYLLVKGKLGLRGEDHPVMRRLNDLEVIDESLSGFSGGEGIEGQLEKVLMAIEVMNGGGEEESDVDEGSESESENDSDMKGDDMDESQDYGDAMENDDDHDQDDEEEEPVIAKPAYDENDFGVAKKSKKLKKQIKSKTLQPSQNDTVEDDEIDEKTAAALKAMESDLAGYNDGLEGEFSSEEDDEVDLNSSDDEDLGDGDSDGDGDVAVDDASTAEDGGTSFYDAMNMKSKAQKSDRKQLHAVAPKFPKTESTVLGERAIGYQIMKNRGLIAHKPKINRNPRVKKREQFRKAVIRRKGAVREVRTGETEKYGGEGTGIKSGISRSRKLA